MTNPVKKYQPSNQLKHHHYPALDGLRGLAILLVLLYHNFGFTNFFSFGWISLDLFFVLSGFLITDILLRTVGKKRYLRNFYARRVLRIFPLYYLSLVIFLFIIPQFDLLPDNSFYVEHQGWLWGYIQNWLFILKGDNSTVSLNHLWSLAIEEQFYLIWPLIILLVKRPKILAWLLILTLVLVSVVRGWIWFEKIPGLSYYNLYTFSRVDGLCIGSLVAIARHVQVGFTRKYFLHIILLFALINAIFFLIDQNVTVDLPYFAIAGYTTIALCFGLLVNEGVMGDNKIVNNFFSISPLRFLGRVSYGTYIFHWPLYIIINPVLVRELSVIFPNFSSQVLSAIICMIAAILLGWFSFRYYESYFLRLKDKLA